MDFSPVIATILSNASLYKSEVTTATSSNSDSLASLNSGILNKILGGSI